MQFELTEEHLMIQKAAREFAQNELKPGVIERDEHQTFPTEQVKKMAALGFMGMMVDPKYGRSEEHTSELQSHSFISYAVFCLKKKR